MVSVCVFCPVQVAVPQTPACPAAMVPSTVKFCSAPVPVLLGVAIDRL